MTRQAEKQPNNASSLNGMPCPTNALRALLHIGATSTYQQSLCSRLLMYFVFVCKLGLITVERPVHNK